MRALMYWALGSVLACGPAYSGATIIRDADGDGLADTADVGDTDGDGVLEMEDIQQALDALPDPGMKVVRLEPGRYVAPPTTTHRWGVLQLYSNTILEGSGWETILEGMSGNCDDAASCPHQVAVVSNADIEAGGNFGIVVRNLQVDGRAPEEYPGAFTPTRPGVRFTTTQDVLVENVWVHHVYHTCLYTSDSRDVAFVGNEAHDCGGFDRLDPAAAGYPGVYVYSNQGPARRIQITRNTIRRTGNTAVNFRKARVVAAERPRWLPRRGVHLVVSAIEDVILTDNEISDNVGIRTVSRCLNTSGVDGMTATGIVCRNTAGVQVTPANDYFEAETSVHSSRRLVIDGISIEGTMGGNPLEIGQNVSDSIFRRVRIVGSEPDTPCLVLFDPVRNLRFDTLILDECGGPGIRTLLAPSVDVTGSGQRAGEALRFRDVRVMRASPWEATAYPALQFLDDCADLRVDALRVSGPYPVPYRFEASVQDSMIRICPYDDPAGSCTIDRY